MSDERLKGEQEKLSSNTEATAKEFDLLLGGLTKTDQEQTLDWNARVLFTKSEKLLPAKNFHIIDSDEKIVGDQFIGTIRVYAVGKFTKKKVAVIFLISGAENARYSILFSSKKSFKTPCNSAWTIIALL